MPRVSVVIPTWNGRELLAEALRSLDAQTFADFEAIVVDNGSTDGTAEMVSGWHRPTRLVRLETNHGFAEATNLGIRASVGEIVVLMNNDAMADDRWLASLVAALDANPHVGSCASRMLMYRDRDRIDSAGDQLGIFASQIGHGQLDGPAFSEPRRVLSACAGAAAYRRSMLDEVGLLDERFFAYLEDVDLGIRATLAGWGCLYVPDAVVYHYGSATSNKIPERKFLLLMRNSLYIFFQYMPLGRLVLWGLPVLLWPVVRARIVGVRYGLGLRCVWEFLRDLPAVIRRRREVFRGRRISRGEFRALLVGPLVRQPSRPSWTP
jgi:GT2 family glycosyltransferase